MPQVKPTALVLQNIPPDVQARVKDGLTLWVVAVVIMAGIPAFLALWGVPVEEGSSDAAPEGALLNRWVMW
jgi:hypothetical protein